MLSLLLSILSLVVSGVSAAVLVRTMRARYPSPTELLAEWAEMQAEWGSTIEMLSRQLKKLAKREKDAARTAGEAEPTAPTIGADKALIRAEARRRGMIR